MINSSQTLRHLRVLNTRPLNQNKNLNQAIIRAGGHPIPLPLITIEPTPTNWLHHLPNLKTIKQAIFISVNAVNFFYKILKKNQLSWPSSIITTAIGNTTAKAMIKWHTHAHQIPSIADSEHLLMLPSLKDVQHQTILLIKGEGGRTTIKEILSHRGANLISLDVYRPILPTTIKQKLQSEWHDNTIDIILFTSEQSIKNLFALLDEVDQTRLCNTPCLVISERLKEAAARLGIKTIIISRYDKIISSLEHYNKGRCHDNG